MLRFWKFLKLKRRIPNLSKHRKRYFKVHLIQSSEELSKLSNVWLKNLNRTKLFYDFSNYVQSTKLSHNSPRKLTSPIWRTWSPHCSRPSRSAMPPGMSAFITTPVLRPPTKINPNPPELEPSHKSITSTCDHSLLKTIITWAFRELISASS